MKPSRKYGQCGCPKGKKHRWECPECGYGHKFSNKEKFNRGTCKFCGYCSLGHKWERDEIGLLVCINCGIIGNEK